MGGKFVCSLDFEKYWGVRDHFTVEDYRENLENVDRVVRRLLSVFRQYEIHATWAVVGFLLHEGPEELKRHLPADTWFYENPSLNPYSYIQKAHLEASLHFAKDVVAKIAKVPFQEIASHTYSHYYCLEDGQTAENLREDLALFQTVSCRSGYEVSTIIFPRNQVNPDYIPLLREFGITAYRGNEKHYLYSSGRKLNTSSLLKRGLRFIDRYVNLSGYHTFVLGKDLYGDVCDVSSSRFLAAYNHKLRRLEPLRAKRTKDAMRYAAENNQIFHLWWHPHNFGAHIEENMRFLGEILEYFTRLNREYGMQSRNIQEVVLKYKVMDKTLETFPGSNMERK
jgi:peptidoglycan/xylan/chitin deacetylase (PgdA/CDA1 family)